MTENDVNENVDNNEVNANEPVVNIDNIVVDTPAVETTPVVVPTEDVVGNPDVVDVPTPEVNPVVEVDQAASEVPVNEVPVSEVPAVTPPVGGEVPTVNPVSTEQVVTPEISEEPVIKKVIDVDKQKKMRLIIIGAVAAVLLIVIILVIALSGSKKDKSTINKRDISKNGSAFVNSINASKESGFFDKEINRALKDVGINTNLITFVTMDLDSDNEKELVGYAEDGSKKFVFKFEVYDGDVIYEDKYQVDSEGSLNYAYSISEDKPYWTTSYMSEYTVIKHPKRVLKSVDYLDDFYLITDKYKEKSFFDGGIEYRSGSKINATKLEKNEITQKKLLEDKKIAENDLKGLATKYKTEREQALKAEEDAKKQKEQEEAEKLENSIPVNINGLTIHYGFYHESGTILYGNFVLHQNGTCELGGNKCTWYFGSHDFGKGPEKSIEVQKGAETLHFTCHENDKITDGSTWVATHEG